MKGAVVSGAITYLVKEEVGTRPVRGSAVKALTGFLAHLPVPDSVQAWRSARREASRALVPRAAKGRRRSSFPFSARSSTLSTA
jgi:hypothetical protein